MVLCGGRASRFGSDKTAAPLGGWPVLDVVLAALPASWAVVCVGPARATERPGVRWTRERPPGGGPVAAVAAGLALVESDTAVLIGGDMPFAGELAPALVAVLDGWARDGPAPDATDETGTDARGVPATDAGAGPAGDPAPEPPDAVVARDEDGRVQPLLLAARVPALRAALPERTGGVPLMRLLDRLRWQPWGVPAGAVLDIDTPGDLARAHRRVEP